MTKKKERIELVNACKEIIHTAKKHSYLWDDPSLWKDSESEEDREPEQVINLFWGFVAQDETYHIGLKRVKDKFIFEGRNFCEGEGRQPGLRDIASRMQEYNVSADKLKERFYSALKEPLGKYLAEEYMKRRNRK